MPYFYISIIITKYFILFVLWCIFIMCLKHIFIIKTYLQILLISWWKFTLKYRYFPSLYLPIFIYKTWRNSRIWTQQALIDTERNVGINRFRRKSISNVKSIKKVRWALFFFLVEFLWEIYVIFLQILLF